MALEGERPKFCINATVNDAGKLSTTLFQKALVLLTVLAEPPKKIFSPF